MSSEYQFKGAMSGEYQLIRKVYPHFGEMLRLVAETISRHAGGRPVRVVNLSCGDGQTAHTILAACPTARVIAIDNDEKMIQQAGDNLEDFVLEGRCQLECREATGCLSSQPGASFDVVASALTLHNLPQTARHQLHGEILRVLKPGGVFVNADKYAEGDAERFRALGVTLGRFFDVFVPLGKLDLLRSWVLHNVADQGPERVMKEIETIDELKRLGFASVTTSSRMNMEALLVATKAG